MPRQWAFCVLRDPAERLASQFFHETRHSRSAFTARSDAAAVATKWATAQFTAAQKRPFHRDCHYLEQLTYLADDAVFVGELPAAGCTAAAAPSSLQSSGSSGPCNIMLRYERLHEELDALLRWAGLHHAVGMLPKHNTSACRRAQLPIDENTTRLVASVWSKDLRRLGDFRLPRANCVLNGTQTRAATS